MNILKIAITTIISAFILNGCSANPVKLEANHDNKFIFEDFQKSFALVDAAISLDGKTIYYITNKQKYPMIWSYDVATKTDSLFFDLGRPISSVYTSPNGKYLIFEADQSGDENHELFSLNIESKKLTDLSQRKGARNGFCGFADDQKTISFMSNSRDKAQFDIYKLKMNDAGDIVDNPKVVIQSKDINTCGRFNKSLSEYSFIRFKTNTVQEVWSKNLKTGKETKISSKQEASYSGATFLADESQLISISNVKTDFKNIVKFNLKSKKISSVTNEKWNVVQYLVDPDSHLAVYVTNEDGAHKLKIFDDKFKNQKSINLPTGVIKVFGWEYKNAKNILMSVETAQQPTELYIYNLKENRLEKVSNLNQSPIPRSEFVDNSLVKLKSEDGVEFSAWLLEPPADKKNGIGLVMVHGGPEDQVLPNYSPYRQFLVNQGFTVIMPNFRGSTGYGTKFQKLIYGDWGGGHIKDVMASRKYLIDQLNIKENKISILGGSFGGFSVLSSITQHQDKFCAAVDIFGPSNLFSFLESMPAHWHDTMNQLVGDPIKDKEKLTQISPIFNIEKAKTPLLVIQGANDPRVVKKESDQVVEKLKSLGRQVDYIVFPDEGHGFSKNENQVTTFNSAVKHIKTYCGK